MHRENCGDDHMLVTWGICELCTPRPPLAPMHFVFLMVMFREMDCHEIILSYCGHMLFQLLLYPPPPFAISPPLQSPPPTRETVTSMFF